jgi:hypothetical protein
VYHAPTGSETLTIRGVNFGNQYWDSATGTGKTMVASKIAVSIVTMGGTRACTSVAYTSDRKITCTTPVGVGVGLAVQVTVSGQSTTSSSSSDSRSYLRSTYSETDDYNNNVDESDGFTWGFPATLNYSLPVVTKMEMAPSQSATPSSSSLLLDTVGSETITVTGKSFGPSSDGAVSVPEVYFGTTKAVSVTRTSDTTLTVKSAAGTGSSLSIRVVLKGQAVTTALQSVAAAYSKPKVTALSLSLGAKQEGGEALTVLGRYVVGEGKGG